jgi:molybdenum cofactor biosynthesis protein B
MVDWSLVVTSDRVYRGEKRDEITPLVEEELRKAGHTLSYKVVVPNDISRIRLEVVKACERAPIVLITGGTGISPRDVSVDAVSTIASSRVPGFGEAHRRLSWEEVGERSMLSRADAFIVNVGRRCFVAISPGNPNAVSVALRLLIPVAEHIVEQLEGRPHR